MPNCKATFIVALLLPVLSFSQTYLAPPINLQSTYQKQTRTLNGKPGINYWQNSANYLIKANFEPQTRSLTGTEEIDYINNSPDTLKQLVFKLYPNFYKKNASRNFKVEAADLTDGVQIKAISVNGTVQDLTKLLIEGTNMRLDIDPLLTHSQIHIRVIYAYTLNRTSHVRMGQIDSGSYFVAYFFPRIAVYDDIDGWNKLPYLGTEEFYNDFCHFNAEITVPGGYAVWATGNLKNAAEVYSDGIVKKMNRAAETDSVIDVISQREMDTRQVTKENPVNTWKFEADNVTDFVFATSDHYLWQATSVVVDSLSGRRTRVDAVFNPVHKSYLNVIGYARKTVDYMSHRFPKWPFPYPHETVIDGLDQMEYPMMVNDNPLDNQVDDIELTSHEIFHTMFPFYMGINETKYGWMDEGWATIGEWILTKAIEPTASDVDGIAAYNESAGKEDDLPITALTTQLYGSVSYTNSYPKPALGYLYVKDMLGDALFLKALHYYIGQWHGKHPMPYDFFNCMNTGSGLNLNWFWKNWYLDRGFPDQAITKVTVKNKNEYQVIISNIGTKMVPVDLTVYYHNGLTKLIHKDISCWQNGNKAIAINFTDTRRIDRLELGGLYDPDINKKDNVYILRH